MNKLIIVTSLVVLVISLVAPAAQSAMLERRLPQLEQTVQNMPVVGRAQTMMNKQGGADSFILTAIVSGFDTRKGVRPPKVVVTNKNRQRSSTFDEVVFSPRRTID